MVFLIHSAALCSASSSWSMVMDLLCFLVCVICSLAIKNHMYECGFAKIAHWILPETLRANVRLADHPGVELRFDAR
jgi:hypothetical protein